MKRPLLHLAVLVAVLAMTLLRLHGPAPRPVTAPADSFSAMRAHEVLSQLLAENVPHPVGSAANRRIRDRIVDRFQALGYKTAVQQAFICSAMMTCATVENIVARRPDAKAGPAVAAVAHYDSVGSGAGATDDGVNVASLLEVARATRGETFRNDIRFVITDGEEAALLGADAFAGDPRWSKDVTTIINFENRGTSGPSFLFETSRNNRALIAAARALDRPTATSLFYTVYENLPNDTDVTIFKAANLAAVNFAAIGDVVWYHTPLDDLAHVNLRTLQHHGLNALGMVRSLGNADLTQATRGNATYMDLFSFVLLAWPEWLSIVLAVAGVFATAAAIVRRRSAGPRGIALFALCAVLALIAGAICFFVLRHPRWIAATGLATTAAWLAGITVAFVAIRLVRPDERSPLGVALCWNLIGLGLVLTFPGASYLFVVPGLVLAASCFFPSMQPVATAAAAIVLLPFAAVLYHALGAPALIAVALLVALVLSATADAFGRISWKLIVALAALTLLAVVTARLLPARTAERPRRQTIDYVLDADSGRAQWISNVAMSNFARTQRPWRRGQTWERPAPRLDFPPVEIRTQRSPGLVRLYLRSQRRADRLTFIVEKPENVTGLRVNGVAASPRRSRYAALSVAETPGRGVIYGNEAEIEIRTRTADPMTITLRESTYGVPAIAGALIAERQKEHGVTSDEGDLTVVTRRITVP